jgi:hypothetical protein
MEGSLVVCGALCFQHLPRQYREMSSSSRRNHGSACFDDKYARTLVETQDPSDNIGAHLCRALIQDGGSKLEFGINPKINQPLDSSS